jgi:hypothetical protein
MEDTTPNTAGLSDQDLLVERVREKLDEEAVLFGGLDGALMGIVCRFGQPATALYDRDKCVSIFMDQGMDEEEAQDYLDFNVIGAYVGEYTPAFAYTFSG